MISLPRMDNLGDWPQTLMTVTCVLMALSWVAVFLRIYVRAYMIRYFGLDDWFMVLTAVSGVSEDEYTSG